MAGFLEADKLELRPPDPFDTDVRPPGSKSLTNRALLLAAIADGRSTLRGCLGSEDTQLMRRALGELGVGVAAADDATTLVVQGVAGALPARDATIDCGTAGTVARFLTAVVAAGDATVVVDGSKRMRERPMAQLIGSLREQGARIECTEIEGFLPLRIDGRNGRLRGGDLELDRPESSQFVSAIILAATLADAPTRIVLRDGTPARPYVDMTLACVRRFGGSAELVDRDVIAVEPATLTAQDLEVEPDASSATYLLALAAIFGGTMRITGLGSGSSQGDARFFSILSRMGARAEQDDRHTRCQGAGRLHGIDVDLSDMPDTALTVAVAALHAEGPTTIRGVSVLRHHESDRLAVAATELRKLGAEVNETDDGLRITPPAGGPRPEVTVSTYDDHRVAMAFSLAGHVTIVDPGCVTKTFPRYFNELHKLGMVQRAG